MTTKRGRAPVLYRPGRVYFHAGLLLCLAFGLTLAGVHDSYQNKDWIWFSVFAVGEFALVVLYALNAWWWTRWINQTGDYNSVDANVVFNDDDGCFCPQHHHDPDHHQNP